MKSKNIFSTVPYNLNFEKYANIIAKIIPTTPISNPIINNPVINPLPIVPDYKSLLTSQPVSQANTILLIKALSTYSAQQIYAILVDNSIEVTYILQYFDSNNDSNKQAWINAILMFDANKPASNLFPTSLWVGDNIKVLTNILNEYIPTNAVECVYLKALLDMPLGSYNYSDIQVQLCKVLNNNLNNPLSDKILSIKAPQMNIDSVTAQYSGYLAQYFYYSKCTALYNYPGKTPLSIDSTTPNNILASQILVFLQQFFTFTDTILTWILNTPIIVIEADFLFRILPFNVFGYTKSKIDTIMLYKYLVNKIKYNVNYQKAFTQYQIGLSDWLVNL